MLESATAEFLRSATQLPPDALGRVVDEALARWRSGGRDASRAVKASASEQSALDNALRSMLRPRADELEAFRPGLPSRVKSTVSIATRAVLKRHQASEEQYRVLTEPFAAEGVEIPVQMR
ncbi:hypothetical protein BWI15_36260 [Kribbella sp. ALI-6-A]|uniref:hypothetical protein n=1 Tax=Kribbella sp. ALI-6-A TaxID=1933817 RepID=UPI00097BD6A5|nr:hypothetical protein [Kribbella sp. ALI-6-A]ONI68450.1 hypothetical protein BWI15_36260 [Kribbella sp. ALI-6-A]